MKLKNYYFELARIFHRVSTAVTKPYEISGLARIFHTVNPKFDIKMRQKPA